MRRNVRTIGFAAAAVLAVVLVPATPASAVLSGAGWSASWRYYDPTAYEVHLTIPGGRIDGYGTDNASGQRNLFATVQDTEPRDRTCVRMRVFATDEKSLGSATTCDRAHNISTAQFFEALFVHIDLLVDGAITKSFFTFIPSSMDDPNLRTVGTGTSWAYSTAAAFHVEVHRPGVQVIGDGVNQAGDNRILSAAVAHHDTSEGCVAGALADASNLVGDGTCQVGAVPAFADSFVGYIKVAGCYDPPSAAVRCLTMHVPEPH